MLTAIVREPSASLASCELSFVARTPIDLALARRQHQAYAQLLSDLGLRIVTLPAEDALPDAVFVEDLAIVLDEFAVMTRPGAASRRAESASVAQALSRFRELAWIREPGTLDGGDLLRVGRRLFVGASARSNAAAVEQLRELLAAHGYRVTAVPLQGCLHLKSAVTAVADDTLLIQPRWVDPAAFAGFRLIEVDAREEHAANVLRVGDRLVHPANFPRTSARLRAAGYALHTLDVSELQKAEGAVTCCSLVFAAGRAGA